MKMYFSNSDYLAYFDGFLNKLDLTDKTNLVIETHPKWINVHPAILTLAASLALQVGEDNVQIPNLTASSGSYLDSMGLFNFTSQKSPYLINKKDPSGRFIPLTIIKTPDEQSRFISEMIPLLHLPPDKADAIKYVVGELIRNVLEHSMSKTGAIVAAQYYKKSNTIRIGICDNGIGIRQSLSKFWPNHAENDVNAIKWALTPGVSGTTTNAGGTGDNAGAGLFFIKSIVKVTRNYFMIYSGSGIYKLLLRDKRSENPRLTINPEDDRHSERADAPYLHGTLVAIDLTLDSDLDEFDKLLAKIRTSYGDAIRLRQKRQYRRFKFV